MFSNLFCLCLRTEMLVSLFAPLSSVLIDVLRSETGVNIPHLSYIHNYLYELPPPFFSPHPLQPPSLPTRSPQTPAILATPYGNIYVQGLNYVNIIQIHINLKQQFDVYWGFMNYAYNYGNENLLYKPFGLTQSSFSVTFRCKNAYQQLIRRFQSITI